MVVLNTLHWISLSLYENPNLISYALGKVHLCKWNLQTWNVPCTEHTLYVYSVHGTFQMQLNEVEWE